ncbi:hypothetical protein LINPERPRIM_LOCUS22142 [Linum perenne]
MNSSYYPILVFWRSKFLL